MGSGNVGTTGAAEAVGVAIGVTTLHPRKVNMSTLVNRICHTEKFIVLFTALLSEFYGVWVDVGV